MKTTFALAFALASCAQPLRDSRPRAEAARPRDLVVAEVPVLLGAAEGAESVSLSRTARGLVELSCAGGLVVDGTGVARDRVELVPAPGAEAIAFAGREYPGRLVVAPRAAGGLRIVNHLDLEEYVTGVVAAELELWSAEPAELEAQAISARSYALVTLARRRTENGAAAVLFDGVADQAYRGRFVPRPGPGDRRVERKLRAAVQRSRGLVLVRDGRIEDARYHAACGGRTADYADVFTDEPVGPRSVECAPCRERTDEPGSLRWQYTVPPARLGALAESAGVGDRLVAIEPAATDAGGRWVEVRLEGPWGRATIPFKDVRAKLGVDTVRSGRVLRTWPHAGKPIEAGLFLEGLGRGHGVGLCQEGARAYARQGWSAEKILQHYYPGTTVERP